MPLNKPLMKCGHTANATHEDGTLCCVICAGDPRSDQIEENPPSLEGRMALCSEGKGRDRKGHVPIASSYKLAFFEYRPDKEFDRYYCGCWGWD